MAQQADLSNNPHYANSLRRLYGCLHALLLTMAGEEIPEHRPEMEEGSSPTKPREGDEELLSRLLENQEDWGLERETEISRLEGENERLRKALGIDKASAEALGWTVENDRELTYQPFIPLPQPPLSPRQTAPRPLPPGAAYVNMPNMQMQQNMANIVPPQRNMDNMQGMRGMVGRRPAMFGQRGRGGGPPVWENLHQQQPPPQERQWQAQVGLDLS